MQIDFRNIVTNRRKLTAEEYLTLALAGKIPKDAKIVFVPPAINGDGNLWHFEIIEDHYWPVDAKPPAIK